MILDEDMLRSIMLKCLQKRRSATEQLRVETIFQEIAGIAEKENYKTENQSDAWIRKRDILGLNDALKAPAWKIVWDLIIEGVLRPGNGQQEFELPFIQVTNHGEKALQGTINPYDPAGYLQILKDEIPEIDRIIEMYITEAAETLRRNCLLSSTVTLGCASEKAFLLLSEAFRETLNEKDKEDYNKKGFDQRSIKMHHEVFEGYLKKREPQLKSWRTTDWWSNCQRSINFIFPYFRSIRACYGLK